MKKQDPKNMAASVMSRLATVRNEKGTEFNILLNRFALERLLYRLSKSEYSDQFILKGAMLFTLWTEHPHRSTRDLDLLGFGDVSKKRLVEIFSALCTTAVEDDGLLFDEKSIAVATIRRDQEYHGQRVKLVARLGNARLPLQVDIGFGDAFSPEAQEIEFPAILDFPSPKIRAYTRETVIAEKFHAMVVLGLNNSRMKDFYDIYIMAKDFSFDGAKLVKGIQSTFECRRSEIPAKLPLALTGDFGSDSAKDLQWRGFLRRGRLKDVTEEFSDIVSGLRDFLENPIVAMASGKPFSKKWPKGGPWR